MRLGLGLVVVAGVVGVLEGSRCRDCEGEVNHAGVRQYLWNAPQEHKTQLLEEAAAEARDGCRTTYCPSRCAAEGCGPPYDTHPVECTVTDYAEVPADGQYLQITATATGFCQCGNGEDPAASRGRVVLTPVQRVLKWLGLTPRPTKGPRSGG